MSWGLFRISKPLVSVVIDIGSHAIKIIVFEVSASGGNPRVLKKHVLKILRVNDPGQGILRLREFLFDTIRHLGRIPQKILISFGPRFVRANIETWNVYCGPTHRLTNKKELEACFERMFLEHCPTGKALFAYPLDLLVNGYPAEVSALATMYPRDVETVSLRVLFAEFHEGIGAMVAGIRRSLGGMPVEFIPLVASERDVCVNVLGVRDALLIDVGGEDTILTLLKDGRVAATTSFAKGGRNFLSVIEKHVSVSIDEAADITRRYAQGIAGRGLESKIRSLFLEESASWKKGFVSALEMFYPVAPIPPLIFVFGGGAHIPEIRAALSSGDWLNIYSYVTAPQVRLLEGKSVFSGDTLGGAIGGPEDVGLASLIFYAIHPKPLF